MGKLPYMPFYPNDYLRDTRSLSLSAKGVWMDLLCYLWDAKPRGVDTMSIEGWAKRCGGSETDVKLALEELAHHRVCNVTVRDATITVASRRMVRDEQKRQQTKARVRRHRQQRACNAEVRKPAAREREAPNEAQNLIRNCSPARNCVSEGGSNTLKTQRSCNADVTGIFQKSYIRSQISEEEEKNKKEEICAGSSQTTAPARRVPPGEAPWTLSESEEEPTTRQLREQAVEVLNFLNEKTGRHYRAYEGLNGKQRPTASLEKIMARLKAGATVSDCRSVIAMKARQWRTDEKMAAYLRPATLFGREKFEQYVGELYRPPTAQEAS